jgi:hypothetical protein
MRLAVGILGASLCFGCSGPDAQKGTQPVGGAANGAGSSAVSSAGMSSGGAGGAGGGSAGSGGGTAGSGEAPVVELPAGSKEYQGILNLVDADAAAELDAYILDESLSLPTDRHGLTKSLNLLLEHYEETYDFVYFFADHPLEQATNYGKFEEVTHHTGPGGVSEFEIAAEGYATTGRVRGVIGFPYLAQLYPPLAHETAHHWAMFLDDKFGFGTGLTPQDSVPLHWGYVDMNGQLGGFDGATLRCETPAGAMPPACTGTGGRTRYVMGAFGPNANAFRAPPYAPMELYLMGLVPPDKVPSAFHMLTEAAFAEPPTADTVVVEASGIKDIAFADIQQRHGVARLLPEAERHFTSAFVVVSKTPAADSVMTDVATYASVFGNRSHENGWQSFEEATGGLATMTTTLGSRRKVGDLPPAPRGPKTCNLLAQDCERPELACHLANHNYCALAGPAAKDTPCSSDAICGRGLGCIARASAPDNLECEPYCDPDAASGPTSCNSVCGGDFVHFVDSNNATTGGQCFPK